MSLWVFLAACGNPTGVCLSPRMTHSPSGSMSSTILRYLRCMIVTSVVCFCSWLHFPVAVKSASV
jgi:hypothetical protein